MAGSKNARNNTAATAQKETQKANQTELAKLQTKFATHGATLSYQGKQFQIVLATKQNITLAKGPGPDTFRYVNLYLEGIEKMP